MMLQITIKIQGGPKNVPTCFCQNLIKSPLKSHFYARKQVLL